MEISGIFIYPIKSLGGISRSESAVEKRGLLHDRRFMLVDDNGSLISQRDIPQLATLKLTEEAGYFSVSADDKDSIEIPFFLEGDRKKVRVWDSVCDAVAAERRINDWLSQRAGKFVELVYMPDDSFREINPKFNRGEEIVSFADGYPILMIGESSLRDLNSRLDQKVPMDRFRPNLIFKGGGAFAEDRWDKISVGDAILRSTKPCARCVVTTIDQNTGNLAGPEPLKTLSRYRSAASVFPETFQQMGLSETAVLFGQNMVPERFASEIRIGDKVFEL